MIKGNSDQQAIEDLVARLDAEQGGIDIFASNAGYALGGGLNLETDQWRQMMEVHLWAHLNAARAVIPGMVERGGGYLLNTASAAGLLTQLDSGPYAVSKHAAVALAEWLAINYSDRGIGVSVLCPQAVRTNILGKRAGKSAFWNLKRLLMTVFRLLLKRSSSFYRTQKSRSTSRIKPVTMSVG